MQTAADMEGGWSKIAKKVLTYSMDGPLTNIIILCKSISKYRYFMYAYVYQVPIQAYLYSKANDLLMWLSRPSGHKQSKQSFSKLLCVPKL